MTRRQECHDEADKKLKHQLRISFPTTSINSNHLTWRIEVSHYREKLLLIFFFAWLIYSPTLSREDFYLKNIPPFNFPTSLSPLTGGWQQLYRMATSWDMLLNFNHPPAREADNWAWFSSDALSVSINPLPRRPWSGAPL